MYLGEQHGSLQSDRRNKKTRYDHRTNRQPEQLKIGKVNCGYDLCLFAEATQLIGTNFTPSMMVL